MTNHKHLRAVIEDIYTNNDILTDDLTLRLINEFRYSMLYVPLIRDDSGLNFIIYEDGNGLNLIPLFTDHAEFNKFFKDEEGIDLLHYSFEFYQNILKTSDVEGYILNPATEKYVFFKKFILSIKNIPKTNFYSTDMYTIDELKQLKDSKNNALEDFINNPRNVGNYEELFEHLASSQLFTMMVSDADLSSKSENGVIYMKDSGPLAQLYVDKIGGVYATIFSNEDKIKQVDTNKFIYSQLINLSMFVNFVLSEDMDGIISNPQSDNVLIPRVTLLRYSLGFEKFANDEKLSNAIYYMFTIN